MNFFHL